MTGQILSIIIAKIQFAKHDNPEPLIIRELDKALTESFNAGVIVGEEKGMRKTAEIVSQYDQIVNPRPTAKKIITAILSAAEKAGKG